MLKRPTVPAVPADQYTWYVAPVPVVTGVSPPTGATVGGDAVTITGTGFGSNVTDVYFGLTDVTSFTSVSYTQIVLNTPSHAPGMVDVTVKTWGGTSAVDHFTYITPPPPEVTGVSPATGSTLGRDAVTISGTGFNGVTNVYFGSTDITSFRSHTNTQIILNTPAGSLGQVDVTVKTPGGTSAVVTADHFTYVAPVPVVTGVYRTGQWILDYGIDGTVDRRFYYGLPTDIPVVGDFNNDGTTDTGVFRSGQWILDYGMDGTVDRRFYYGLPTDIPVVGDFNNDGTTDIGVFRTGQWILDYGMDGTVDRRFFYGLPTDIPVVGDFNNDGTTDTGVFRSGQWILDYGMDGTVDRRFCYGLPTDNPLVGDFNNDGTTDTGVFRSGQWILDYGIDGTVDRRFYYGLPTDIPIVGKWVTPAPVVTGVSPATGSTLGGDAVTITGTGFNGVTNVYFGITDVTSFTSVSYTQIVLNSPSHGEGLVDVRVKTPGGTSAVVTADHFTYVTPTPVITGVSPATGQNTSTISITNLAGTGFYAHRQST